MKRHFTKFLLAFLMISLGSFKSAEEPVFTGKWDMNCETHGMVLFLVQNDKQIVGTYDVPHGSGSIGYILGMVKGTMFDFEFHEVNYEEGTATFSGTGELKLSAEGNGIEGGISGVYDGGEKFEAKWTGTRMN
jgi:hypothetical protein